MLDKAPFRKAHEPGHPFADRDGYVQYPNIHPAVEQMNMLEASRAYEANITVAEATKSMMNSALLSVVNSTLGSSTEQKPMTDPLGFITNGISDASMMPMKPMAGDQAKGPDFKQLLMKNLTDVNQLQQDADEAIADLMAGRRTDIADVMTAKAKADMAFKMLLQVRNKLVEAYQEIKDMRV